MNCVCWGLLLALPQSAMAQAPSPSGIENARLAEVRNLEGTVYHVQGVDLDEDHIWVTSVDPVSHKGYLHQFDRRTARLERAVELTDGPRFHPGGFSIAGNSIWVPVAEYKPHSSAVLVKLDKHTLEIQQKIAVGDHIGCVAVTGDGPGELIAGNWGSRQLYVFDFRGKQLRVVENQSSNQYQDIKFVDGQLVASGNLTNRSGSLDWYEWPSMKLVRTIRSGATDRDQPYTGEGMALKGNDLYLVPEDGPSRIFHFVLAKP